jgi:hypothetical protein
MTDTRHTCHAWGCQTPVPPVLLMCRHHWRMVPPDLRDAVWVNYRPGQETDKTPSQEYVNAALAAIEAVAAKEGLWKD